jgi:two-component system response regulator HydG
LRDRRDDIPLLVDYFLSRFREKNAKQVMGCSRSAADLLMSHEWPGNVRELENAIERAVVLTRGSVIDVDDLPLEVRGLPAGPSLTGRSLSFEVGTKLEEIELRVIHETLRHTKGDKRLAAQLLGIATRTIYRKLAPNEPAPQEDEGIEERAELEEGQ